MYRYLNEILSNVQKIILNYKKQTLKYVLFFLILFVFSTIQRAVVV